MGDRCRVRVAGPLAPYRDGFWEELGERGYATSTAVTHARVTAGVSRWMLGEGLEATGLTDGRWSGWSGGERGGGRCRWSRRGRSRCCWATCESGGSCRSRSLSWRRRRLWRCCSASTAAICSVSAAWRAGRSATYLDLAGVFLSWSPDGAAVQCLAGEQVIEVVVREWRVRSVESSKTLVCGLRSLLRFLFAKGLTARSLAEAVPTVARRRQRLPQGLDAQTAAAVLSSCDRRTTVGRRDHGILLLLVRLGLRSCEVAALTLEDLDWRAGELRVWTGKGRRVDRLPLPDDVGTALAGYLRHGRPRDQSRAVFLRVRAPRAGLTANGIVERSLISARERVPALFTVGMRRRGADGDECRRSAACGMSPTPVAPSRPRDGLEGFLAT